MIRFLKAFRAATGGAVTIDRIVLVVGVCALGASAVSVVYDGSSSLGQAIQAQLSSLQGGSIAADAN
mgnify:CR=1 FL=1